MTPDAQSFADAVRSSANQIIDNLEHANVPDSFALAVAAYMTVTLIERSPAPERTEIAAHLIARLTTARRLDA